MFFSNRFLAAPLTTEQCIPEAGDKTVTIKFYYSRETHISLETLNVFRCSDPANGASKLPNVCFIFQHYSKALRKKVLFLGGFAQIESKPFA